MLAVIIIGLVAAWLFCALGLAAFTVHITNTDLYDAAFGGGIVFWHLLFWPLIGATELLMGLMWLSNRIVAGILRQKPHGGYRRGDGRPRGGYTAP